ncbi:hypothetical protein P154DRAFT_538505 [Amniculicola lignicola CBS 123094]|uniref:Arb2 domain-containing protein n=1 Tax=Amniculicola lignicola CBS 123094 TaxID=1392246 RepID=A0A6A5WDS3_9PLEO|nr:hypothetical protein P154DRAFT_538505 [Amniculicola lignicola CBS 123094]
MFRRVEQGMPVDAAYEADLKALGYFINSVGQIRMIGYPDKDFDFHFSNNDRHNEVRREAMQVCQRREVEDRLSALGLERLYLPTLNTIKPDGPHIPILAPSPDILKTRKRVIVIINDTLQDLGILAYRLLQRQPGINGGSVVNFAKEIIQRTMANSKAPVKEDFDLFKDGVGIDDKTKHAPGLIILNNGQLLYSWKYNQAKSLRSWSAMPRKSICHGQIEIHDVENRVEGNRNPEEHIKYVFEHVINNADLMAPDAEVYLIAIENGAESLLALLDKDLETYRSRITAMALIEPLTAPSYITNPDLKTFLHQRARQWKISSLSKDPFECVQMPQPPKEAAVNTVDTDDTLSILSLEDEVVCPAFGGGDSEPYGECVFTSSAVQHAVLDFFDEVSLDAPNYRNPDAFLGSPEAQTATPSTDPQAPDSDNDEDTDDPGPFSALPPLDLSPDQAHLETLKQSLAVMTLSLANTSATHPNPDVLAGLAGLRTRITKTRAAIDALTKKMLATGGLRSGEEDELRRQREHWSPKGLGPKIPFAGVMVDEELVRGAGLLDIAGEEVGDLEGLVDELGGEGDEGEGFGDISEKKGMDVGEKGEKGV